jgi:uroporphyrinogen-III synthase
MERSFPLSGIRVAVTRAATQASGLVRALEALGADVLLAPAIAFVAPSDPAPLAAAREALSAQSYSVIVFTSTNGVTAWFGDGAAPLPAGTRVAAVGSETRAALVRHGCAEVFVGESFVADALAEALIPTLAATDRTLLVRAEDGRETFPDALRKAGRAVDVVAAYRTVPGDGSGLLAEALRGRALSVVTFTAGSTVRETWAALDDEGRREITSGRVLVASIGPVTTEAAVALGIPETSIVTASPHTTEALVEAIVASFR